MTDYTATANPQLAHAEDCPGGRIARFDAVHRAEIVCRGCGARVTVTRRNEWRDIDD